MSDYKDELEYELTLMRELHGGSPSDREWAARVARAWPELQKPGNEHRLKRVMEILDIAKARRERIRSRLGL
jgi:hypothetical protein